MKKAKRLSNKLMAALLSMAMILTTVLPSTTVYAAEPAIEAETAGSEDSASDNEVPDGIGTENETGSEEGSGETTPGGEETLPGDEDTLPGDGETNEPGSGEENSGETTPGDEETDEPGLGEDGSDENDADAEGSDENAEGEETGEEIEAEDPLEDVELLEDNGYVRSNITVADSAVTAGGWNESLYAEITGNVEPSDVAAVRWSGNTGYSGGYTRNDPTKDLDYLVRKVDGVVRIDIPGIKAGTYELTIEVGSSTIKKSNLEVYAYDRSGYAHFNYTEGVGAYKDDGTIKDKAEILYVTDANKNDVKLTVNGITVTGIGNILNSVGQEDPAAPGQTKPNSKGKRGKANSNKGIIKELARAGKPLVVRFIGTVSDSGLYEKGTFSANSPCKITGLTVYNSLDNGGSEGDNGHMARIQSGKYVTLEGIGYDATIDGWGFHYIAQGSDTDLGKSFEVRNLTFINTPEDAVGMEGQQEGKKVTDRITSSVERCWVHNNEFYCPHIDKPAESDKSEGDGSVDFKRGQYFTCSYNYFEDCHKTNLVGSADYSLQYNLTYHHNYWYMCRARGPLTRNANVHMYNNIFEMQRDYAMNTRADAYIFSEYNMFYACKSPQAVEGGAIKSYNDTFASALWKEGVPGTVVTDKSEKVPNNCKYTAGNIDYSEFDTKSSLSYIPDNDYQLQTDFAKLRKVIVSQTGVQEKNPRLDSEITTSDYSVVKKYDSNPKTVVPSPGNDLFAGLKDSQKKIGKNGYAFNVGGSFNVTIGVSSTSKNGGAVLVNEEGESLLEIKAGNEGSRVLLAGTYIIQSMEDVQPGDPAKGTIATFKEIPITKLLIEPVDENAHYHQYVLNVEKTKAVAATCTAAGYNVYDCVSTVNVDKCNEPEKREPVAALGHSWGSWEIITAATDEAEGLRKHTCSRCNTTVEESYKKVSSGSGSGGGTGDSGSGGGSTLAGNYILTFEGMRENDADNFFTVSGNYSNSKGSATVNEETYTECLKMETSTSVSFRCNDGAVLRMAFASTETGKTVKVDGIAKTTDAYATVTVDNLSAGTHTITKGDTINLFYVSVDNKESDEVYYTLTLDYNDEDAPSEPKALSVLENTTYATLEELVSAASFTRTGYTLEGLYKDASCDTKVTFPYTVNANATLYANWEDDSSSGGVPEVTYNLLFETDGGSTVATVKMTKGQTYYITQTTTKPGYIFAGWFDKDGNPIDAIENPTSDVTVYAHWSKTELDDPDLTLICATDLVNGDITSNKEVRGFTIHAAPGGGGSNQDSPKYYMTVKDNMLYTNGVLLNSDADKSIQGNEKGLLKSIEFTTDGPGTLYVEVQASGKLIDEEKGITYTCNLNLAQMSSSGTSLAAPIKILDITSTSKTTKEFDINEAGTYYLYAGGTKGVAYTSIKFSQPVYTIVYKIGTGTAKNLDTAPKPEGAEVKLPDCTPFGGYIFTGWSVDGGTTPLELEDNTYIVKGEDAVGGVITFTALYDVDPNYKPGGSGGGGGDEGDPDPESGLVIVGLEKEYIYTGAKITPNIGVVDYNIGEEGKLLSPGIDYTVKYSNNVKLTKDNKAGKAKVTVTGKGNYTGKDVDETFEIVSAETYTGDLADLKGAKIDKIEPMDFNGEEQYPDFKLTLSGKSAVTYRYDNGNYYKVESGAITTEILPANWALSNNRNKGTATLLLTGKVGTNKKATTVKKTFKINAIDLSKVKASDIDVKVLDEEAIYYSVKGATPKVEVTVNGAELIEGTDYTVKYSANKTVTKSANITITGKGNYAKKPTKQTTFEIKNLDMNDLEVAAVTAYSGMTAGKVKATVLDANGNILKASQYTVEVYKDADCAGKYGDKDVLKSGDENKIYVVAKAKDIKNLKKDSATPAAEFTVGENIAKAKFVVKKDPKLNKAAKTYTGSEIKLENGDLTVTMKGVSGNLTMGTDYVIAEYSNNINKGTATAVIKGIGKYSGTKNVKFKIVAKQMNITKSESTWDSVTSNIMSFVNDLFN
ncbi:MAG: InlB B-repeat-containing protein [Lachnospiraceae bacterium]|nr:InlB B-repeat-containing protein [Lachnospiraceae bacterium]